jgi:hypothetical protein
MGGSPSRVCASLGTGAQEVSVDDKPESGSSPVNTGMASENKTETGTGDSQSAQDDLVRFESDDETADANTNMTTDTPGRDNASSPRPLVVMLHRDDGTSSRLLTSKRNVHELAETSYDDDDSVSGSQSDGYDESSDSLSGGDDDGDDDEFDDTLTEDHPSASFRAMPPTDAAAPSASTVAAASALPGTDDLPADWQREFDEKSQCHYYFNVVCVRLA